MNVPLDTLAFAERSGGAGFGHDQARVLPAAFGQAQDDARDGRVTKDRLDARPAEMGTRTRQIADNGKGISNRLRSTVTIIAGVATAISATIGAAVALILKWGGI